MKILKIIIAIVSGLRLVGSAEASPPELGRMLVNSGMPGFGVSWKCPTLPGRTFRLMLAPASAEVDFMKKYILAVLTFVFDGRVVTVENGRRPQAVNVDRLGLVLAGGDSQPSFIRWIPIPQMRST